MTTRADFYVSLFRRWLPNEDRFSTRIGVSKEREPRFDDRLGYWRVSARSRDEAMGTVAEYLLRGGPDSMMVESLDS